jgi:hypothetical protein
MRPKHGYRLALALVTMVVLRAAPTRAEEYGEDTAPRTLGRLQFVPSSLVAWGFIDNAFTFTSSAAWITYGVGPLDLTPHIAIGSRHVELVGVAQTVSGSAALAPWLGVTARLSAASDIPRNVTATALVGVHVNFGVEGDAFLRLVRAGPLQITARGDFGYDQNRDILPTFLRDRVQIGHVTTIRPTLVAAVAITPLLGLQASGSYSWQWFDFRTSGRAETIQAAAAVTISLHPFPVTLLGGAGAGHETGDSLDIFGAQALYGSGGTWGRAEGGVYYTGRRHLDLGVDATYQFSDTDGDRRWWGDLRIGYYF